MAQRGVNKMILMGNLGQDPEVRYMPSGGAVANISVATSESWKDKATGEQKEKQNGIECQSLEKLAEIAGEYLRKGSTVYIEGQLQTHKCKDQNGKIATITEIVVQGYNGVMQMIGGKSDSQGAQQGGYTQPQPTSIQHTHQTKTDLDDTEILF